MNPIIIVVLSICAAGLLAFVIQRVVRAHRRQASAGREELVGRTAEVEIVLEPKGIVLVEGERWTAVSEKGRIKPGEEVVITKVDGLTLSVIKKQKGQRNEPD